MELISISWVISIHAMTPPCTKGRNRGRLRPRVVQVRAYEAETFRRTAATKQSTTDTPSPGKPGSEGKRLPPVTMHNTVNVTFTGMESVENAIKKALEVFSREMEGRITAIRDQQARLSFGG